MGNKLTQVAIIGRPNVGKSTLFNFLTRMRKSLVKNQPGVTRDILIEKAEWWGKTFEVVDTGGITESRDGFSPLIREQVLSVLSSIDLLIVVMDGRVGLVPEDKDVVRLAKESGKPFLLVVNKVDQMFNADILKADFYLFGEEPICASFEKRDNTDVIIEWILSHIKVEEVEDLSVVRLAIVGRPNAGKSSLCNRFLGQKRMLVSDIPGTTVDPVESDFDCEGVRYRIVDTAGLRRSSRRDEGVEFLSAIKSLETIRRADLVLLVVDAAQGVAIQDARIVEEIIAQHKAVILVANKLDLGEAEIEAFRQQFRSQVAHVFHFFDDIPLVFTSAETGKGIQDLLKKMKEVWDKLHVRISTSKLNEFFYETIRQAPAPVAGVKDVKFYYLTQTHQMPPSFIAFANYPEGVTPSYRRFLSKRIQGRWNLEGIPIRMFVMKSGG